MRECVPIISEGEEFHEGILIEIDLDFEHILL